MDDRSIDALIEQLHSADQREREAAARHLAERKVVRAVEPLLDLYLDPQRQPIPDPDGDISWAIPFALREFGEAATKAIIPRLGQDRRLISMLGHIGHISAVEVLIGLYHNPAFLKDQWPIVTALGCFPSEQARIFLEHERDTTTDANLRNQIDVALYYIGKLISYHSKDQP